MDAVCLALHDVARPERGGRIQRNLLPVQPGVPLLTARRQGIVPSQKFLVKLFAKSFEGRRLFEKMRPPETSVIFYRGLAIRCMAGGGWPIPSLISCRAEQGLSPTG
ncbi:hypothetical protein C3920_00675 [Novacetimonas pomaceti]|uniref:Uncharacterized protein n=1 Tax=Novacetimonas pomaceti TaxID=2021998 RepID=A0ABX5P6Z0_9PROT|nr:hypothetical protein C3920_00675 [Novacetimonas pomaceti]